MCSPTNNWGKRRTEHRFYVKIATDIALHNLVLVVIIITAEWVDTTEKD